MVFIVKATTLVIILVQHFGKHWVLYNLYIIPNHMVSGGLIFLWHKVGYLINARAGYSSFQTLLMTFINISFTSHSDLFLTLLHDYQ